MSELLSNKDKQQLLAECLDPRKVTLTCDTHHFYYGSKKAPNFRCKKCALVNSISLIANTPPEKRQEMLEMFEWTVHKLVEAAKNGTLTRDTLHRHPQVTIDKNVN